MSITKEIKNSRRPRRTNEKLHRDLFDNLAIAIREIGFQKLTLQDVCRYADIRPNIIYNRYGSLTGLLEAFCSTQHEYWANSISSVSLELLIRNPKEYYCRIADGLIEALYSDEGFFCASLIWELAEDNPITRNLDRKREERTAALTRYLDEMLANSKIDSSAVNAILIAGMCYLAMRRDRSPFNGIDFSSEHGRRRLTEAIHALIDFIFQVHEKNGILAKLIREGVGDEILCRSYGITPDQLRFFKENIHLDTTKA